MAAAPLIMKPRTMAVVAVAPVALPVFEDSKAVVARIAYAEVELFGASGTASQPTATVRINRAKTASAIRLFMKFSFLSRHDTVQSGLKLYEQ
ncbi:hypothetical protein ACFQZZ_29635 [Nocardia sp. GCM10030253]|uniref:hypothetical protein n=1 Tax=Nocardia sp. GCM10030253 TaxID=3273404 RepID=UPI00362E4B3C